MQRRRSISLQSWAFHRRRAAFYGMLAAVLRRGDTLAGFLAQQSVSSSRGGAWAAVSSRLHALHALSPACPLGELLQGVMPSSDAGMLVAVDSAAVPHAALEALSDAVAVRRRLSQAIVTQVVLPVVLLALACGLSLWLCQKVLALQGGVSGALPLGMDHGLGRWAHVMAQHGTDLIVSLLIVVVPVSLALVWWLPRWIGPRRSRVDAWPLLSLYRDVQALRLLTALPVALRGGQSLMSSVQVLTAESRSPWVRWQSRRMREMLKEQPSLPLAAFNRGWLSRPWFLHVAEVAATRPVFQDALARVGTRDALMLLNRFKARARWTFLPVVVVAALLPLVLGGGLLTASAALENAVVPLTRQPGAEPAPITKPPQPIPVSISVRS